MHGTTASGSSRTTGAAGATLRALETGCSTGTATIEDGASALDSRRWGRRYRRRRRRYGCRRRRCCVNRTRAGLRHNNAPRCRSSRSSRACRLCRRGLSCRGFYPGSGFFYYGSCERRLDGHHGRGRDCLCRWGRRRRGDNCGGRFGYHGRCRRSGGCSDRGCCRRRCGCNHGRRNRHRRLGCNHRTWSYAGGAYGPVVDRSVSLPRQRWTCHHRACRGLGGDRRRLRPWRDHWRSLARLRHNPARCRLGIYWRHCHRGRNHGGGWPRRCDRGRTCLGYRRLDTRRCRRYRGTGTGGSFGFFLALLNRL